MAVSSTEARARAQQFVNDWTGTTDERSESQPFWEAFFRIFGLERRHIARFEKHVNYDDGGNGFIDVFWPGKLLCEQKGAGKSLDAAFAQAIKYVRALPVAEVPRYVIVSDFATFRLFDLDTDESRELALEELPANIELFDFIRLTDEVHQWDTEQVEASVKASEKLAELHDLLHAAGYTGHRLEIFMVRLLFCFFAEDAGIFEPNQFSKYAIDHSETNGTGLGPALTSIFEVLDTPEDERMSTLNQELASFPYVNGGVFSDRIPTVNFDANMRLAFYYCSHINWSSISPSIFGSIFQGVMDQAERRAGGAHYTTEENIRKVIYPLFMDDLYSEFVRTKNDKRALRRFHERLGTLTFFDPACGCGNFLTTTLKELRHLEDQVLEVLWDGQTVLDVRELVKVTPGQFYGIELLDFPTQIANVAIWLADHQANIRTGKIFGTFYRNLPLVDYDHIVQGNALTKDWAEVIAPEDCDYVFGNPPFVGARYQSPEQKSEMETIFAGVKNWGNIDYVGAWFMRAAQYTSVGKGNCAFVATNSICQGEQVANLWKPLMEDMGVTITFAHRTFRWTSEARGAAHVYCVIVGFSVHPIKEARRWLYTYQTPSSEPVQTRVQHINAYLVDAPNVFVYSRSQPINGVPNIGIGNQPIDGGHFLFTSDEMREHVQAEPNAMMWFKRWLGAKEFLNGDERWCLWLGECPPSTLKKMPLAMDRVRRVREFRLKSKRKSTIKLADTPTRFEVENMPQGHSVVIPGVSSERRKYIPVGYIGPETLASNLLYLLPNASLYDFGILHSLMHNAWMRQVAGRLESRYRYSAGVVYNNFPWPDATDDQRAAVERAAQGVLDARSLYPGETLADLYDPNLTPKELVQAHNELDRAVERAYGIKANGDEAEIVRHLFTMYTDLTSI